MAVLTSVPEDVIVGDLNVITDTSCAVFARDLDLDPAQVHRFVVGEDAAPRLFAAGEAEQELGDPFATFVLLKGTFPKTGEDAVKAMKEAVAADDPLRNQMSFLLGEGSQIPFADSASLDRGIRFVVTLGATANGPPDGPDFIISVFHPSSDDIELMAWDRRNGGFNYYRSVGEPPAWVFAGNSRHALTDPTQGKGPFESHKSGALLMKELKLPWVNWDSPNARIFPTVFANGDERKTHPWFTQKEPGGAYTLELAVVRPAIARWERARFDALLAGGGQVDRPARVVEQIVGTPTANLFSSVRESESPDSSGVVELPDTFFVDSDGLAEVGLDGPPQFAVSRKLYADTLRKFKVRLTDNDGFTRDGDTHFAFLIPERAFEDVVTLREALGRGLITRRLAAALLMTDFPNPVFSERRQALLDHVPATATVNNKQSSFSEEFADAIVGAAAASPANSPEREFTERWDVGEDFEATFNGLLAGYYTAVNNRVGTAAGFEDYFRLAESRRNRVRQMPIFENPLLFATTNIGAAALSMHPDGSVS